MFLPAMTVNEVYNCVQVLGLNDGLQSKNTSRPTLENSEIECQY